jgi:hypothetical protein
MFVVRDDARCIGAIRKLPMKRAGDCAPCGERFLWIIETTDVTLPAVQIDIGFQASKLAIVADSSEAACVVATAATIASILRACRLTKVEPSIVVFNAIFVVDLVRGQTPLT